MLPQKYRRFIVNVLLNEAYKSKKETGLPASVITAQAILESGWGGAVPVDIYTGKYSFNLFGIKGKGNNGYVIIWTHEYVDGKKKRVKDKFRAYKAFKDSFIDYGNLILSNPRYSYAVEHRDNPRKYIDGLIKGEYATDPEYKEKLIFIIKKYIYNGV